MATWSFRFFDVTWGFLIDILQDDVVELTPQDIKILEKNSSQDSMIKVKTDHTKMLKELAKYEVDVKTYVDKVTKSVFEDNLVSDEEKVKL